MFHAVIVSTMSMRSCLAFRIALLMSVMITGTLAHAQQSPTDSTHFETAAIHPSQLKDGCFSLTPPGSNHFEVTCIPLRAVVQLAFAPDELEGPDKALDTAYDIRATLPDAEPWTMDTVKPMLRTLLMERFHLVSHTKAKSVSGYELIVGSRGSRMKASEAMPAGVKNGISMNYIAAGRVQGRSVSADAIADLLGLAQHTHIVNGTDLKGAYDIDLKYAPEDSVSSELPQFSTAVKEQLGLELKPASVPITVMVVDHVDTDPLPN
jgi:uncharacterized protein (TIGR03435 family)